MESFSEFITEIKHEDIVCRCHGVTVGQLLEKAKFNQDASTEEILRSLKIGTSCGGCLKKNCKENKNRCDVHYSKVLK
jgi:NAD(P)H-nitrite reductase large subunit